MTSTPTGTLSRPSQSPQHPHQLVQDDADGILQAKFKDSAQRHAGDGGDGASDNESSYNWGSGLVGDLPTQT